MQSFRKESAWLIEMIASGLYVGQIFTEVKTGQIGICKGPILAAANVFNVTVRGKSTHGALPLSVFDAVIVAAEIILALQKNSQLRGQPA
jgi:metal-dependent amidase/aminoacylase/carboxypeptidase family protein